MFEHMMFKGSERVPPEEHAKMISSLGGSNNAFTGWDVTAYHNTVPSQYLRFAMELEAERMHRLHLTESTISSEREVVKEEKRMRLENSPIGRALEAVYDLAYTAHPYAWTPAGTIADLNQMTRAQFQAFYETYYVPNNATLIVVGDVAEREVRRLAEEIFGAIPRGEPAPPVTAVEPPQRKIRERVADWPSQLGVVLGAYHVPEARHPDMAALRVISALLSAGRSARLHQALVRRGKNALAAGGFVQAQEHPGLLFIYAVGLPTHDLAEMRRTLLSEVGRLAAEPVPARELAKVKNQLATSHLRHLERLQGLAHQIGQSLYTRGDARAFLTDVERLDRVSAADVARVAKAYLTDRNLSLVLLDASKRPAAGPAGGGAR
jgi:zinc protease